MFYYRSLSNWRKHQAFMKRCLSILAVGLMPVIFVQAKENCSEAVYAQSQQQRTVTVKGTVTDADGLPAIGANVLVKGTSIGTMTDTNGSFSFEAPADAVLEVSYIGFESQEISLNGRTNLNIVLQVNKRALDEVVVVAYGTQKARAVTGSMSKMDAETLKDQPVSQIGEKLQGKFAGVQVNQANGEPNGGLTIRIRGAASVNGGNAPLIVIDGFPSSTGLESISPEEIETVTVLKDAAASSLYGSRAANGVILVTTKTAKQNQGKPKIEFSAYYGVEIVPQQGRPDVMNAQEFAQFKKEYYEDAAKYEGYTGGVPECYAHPELLKEGTDWLDVLLRNASNQNYNLNLSAGTDKLRSSVNVNYNNKEGVVLETFSDRFAVRSNNSYVANDHLTFGLNLSGSYTKGQLTGGFGNGRVVMMSSILMDPQLKYKNDDGTYPISYSQPGMFANPNFYLVLKQTKTPSKTLRGTVNAYVDMNIIEGLKYRLSANADLTSNSGSLWVPSTANGGMFSAPPQPAYGRYSTSNNRNWLVENTLTYHKTLWDDHNFDVLLGYTAQKSKSENARINANQYPDDEISWFGAAINRVGNSDANGWGTWSLISYLGRFNYDYKGKYLLQVSYRRDGCSRFGSDARWADFPSVSLGWIVSDESFMKSLDKLSYLKIRGSYGTVGNYNIGNYTSLNSIGSYNYVFNGAITSGRAISAIGNSNLTWEKTNQWDLGMDIGFFNDRIFLVYDFYRKQTKGLLYQIDIPYSTGFSSVPSNIGKFRFWGHEISLETKNLVGKFRWNTQINVSIDRNRAIQLGTNNTPIGGYYNQGDYNRTVVGRHLGEFYGYIYDGVFMTQEEYEKGPKHYSSMVGTVRMKDLNDDNIIDEKDRTFIGDPNPDFTFGITNTFSWKNFDASLLLTGSVGNDILDAGYESYENIDGCFNVFKYVKDRWRSEDNPGKGIVPRTRAGTTELFRYNNSRWVDDGSYLRVKNLTIGYTVPLKSADFISGLRVYFSAQNLLTITGYHGMNPEISSYGYDGLRQGVDYTAYPVARVYSFGLNLNF